ncbi:MAG: hydrolase [Woeseiaceae bacterium]|nr:hydrolase [Woeseiaceae bacterium]
MTSTPDDKNLLKSEFRPAWWLRHRHLQTIYPSFPWSYRHRPGLRREILDLPDGDATAVDWVVETDELPATSPLLVILHGLESSAQSAYARMLMQAAADQGWHCCVMHFRDCGDYSNRLPRRYHAGETNDVRFFLERLEDSEKYGPIAAAGFSLGGNVLLKYLGESSATTPLRAATAVCVPLNLHSSADALNIGFSRVYQSYLIKRMKRSLSDKFDRHTFAFDWQRAMGASTFAEFDDAVTAPLHGFDGKNDYYDRCSSMHFLASIDRPTLILNALDDPFMTTDMFESIESISANVTIEASERGGHVGFIEGGTPWKPRFYLPRRIVEYLTPYMAMPGM